MKRGLLTMMAAMLISPVGAACSPGTAAVSATARADCPGVDVEAVRCRDD